LLVQGTSFWIIQNINRLCYVSCNLQVCKCACIVYV
jgi:hypothetical protein